MTEGKLIVFADAAGVVCVASRVVTLVMDPFPGMRLHGAAARPIVVSHVHVRVGVEPGITIWGTLEGSCASPGEARSVLGEGWTWVDERGEGRLF